MSTREVLVGPNGVVPNPLILGELGVGPVNDLSGGIRVLKNQGGVDLYRGALGKADDDGVGDVRVLDENVLDVLGEDVLAAGEGLSYP